MQRFILLFVIVTVVSMLLFLFEMSQPSGIVSFFNYYKNIGLNQTMSNYVPVSRTSSFNAAFNTVKTGPSPALPDPFLPPSNQLPDRKTLKENWKGDCSYPSYISEKVQQQPWFPRYLYHLQRVNLSTSSKGRRAQNCARWWYATPQLIYTNVPPRKIGWKAKLPPDNFIRPNCTDFEQKVISKTRCSKAHEKLWRYLEKLGVVYFPRSGTELGIVREGGYLSKDGDIDVFVDMPQAMLINVTSKVLTPRPYTRGNLKKYNAETHWRVKGCPAVHMVFNDWMADETSADFGRPNHKMTCECLSNSIRMSCHKKAKYRMYVQYGPSWRVPLGAKALDVPQYARGYNIVRKLKKMALKDGLVYEEAVRALNKSVKYGTVEMEMILAQLNVLKELIAYQLKTKNYYFV